MWRLRARTFMCFPADDSSFEEVRELTVEGDQRKEDVTRTFTFGPALQNVRFIRFHVEGTKMLPDWHPSAGGMSWVFVDEIVVR